MRILHVLDHSLPVQSGYAYRTLAILREQAAMGFETLQLTTPKQRLERGPKEVVDGWEFHRTPVPPSPPWAPRALREYHIVRSTARRLGRLARQWGPDVVHAHSPVLNGLAALSAGRQLGLPVVYEVRALWEDAATSHGTIRRGSLRYALARQLETRAVRRADAVVTICEGLYQDLRLRGVGHDNMFIVPNGVDVASFLPDSPVESGIDADARSCGPVIGFIGSFYAYEGLDLLVEAARRLLSLRPGVRFILVGGGPDEARIRELCRASDLDGCVTLPGWVPHHSVDEWYRQIDVLVYPRRRNRLTELVTPLKPLEAMAKGKVILASDVGGHCELIEEGRTGFLFRSEDAADLLRRLIELLDMPDRWQQTGVCARRFVEDKRTWKAVAATYAQVYDRALARSRHAGRGNPP